MTRDKTTLPSTEFIIATGNYDESRAVIDRIIIHTTVSSAQSAITHFGNYGTQVSAHYIVGLDGKLYHGLEEKFTAYHCGSYSMNQRSIGIEHEDNGKYNDPRPDALYTESAKLVRDICQFYQIPIDRQHILKHSEIIATGCPDALDIDRIVREAANTEPMATITQKELDEIRLARDTHYNDLQTMYVNYNTLVAQINALKSDLNTKDVAIDSLSKQLEKCEKKPPEIKEKIVYKDKIIYKKVLSEDIQALSLRERIKLFFSI